MSERFCENCLHAESLHGDKYGCEFERGDAWVRGNQAEEPMVLMAQGPCGCKEFVPDDMQAELERLNIPRTKGNWEP
jgi:hypothetical protein